MALEARLMISKEEIRRQFISLMVECEKHLDEDGCSLSASIGSNELRLSFRWNSSASPEEETIRSVYERTNGKRGWATEAANILGITPNSVRVKWSRYKKKKSQND